MQIERRVSFGYGNPDLRERLRAIGIEAWDQNFIVFTIVEDDPRWPAVQELLDPTVPALCFTRFTQEELLAASWLTVGAEGHHGYPMPDGDFGYLDLTYELADYCNRCGLGARQKAPFRMRGEPKWGKRSIMQLNWVFEEYFVTPAVWKTIFGPLGIECWPVLAWRKETRLDTVVQLRIADVLEQEADMGEHGFDICEFCQRKKYLPFTRGAFPAISAPREGVHAIKTKEWFGSGASAFREVLFSQALCARIRDHQIKGVQFGVVSSK